MRDSALCFTWARGQWAEVEASKRRSGDLVEAALFGNFSFRGFILSLRHMMTMASGAGFFLEPTAHAPPRNTVSTSVGSSTTSAPPREPLRLSPSQLTRLRSHLDDALLSIQRRYARRFHDASSSSSHASDPSTSAPPLNTLQRYCSAWTTDILPLVTRIDAYGAAQTTTALAYAMAVTDAVGVGIAGYDLPTESSESSTALQSALQLLGLIDALWSALLVGRSLSLALAQRRIRARLAPSHTAAEGEDEEAEMQRRAERSLRDSDPITGSLGTRTTSATDRVRLRNLLIDRREALSRWMGEQGGVAMPEEEDGWEREQRALRKEAGRREDRRREEESRKVEVESQQLDGIQGDQDEKEDDDCDEDEDGEAGLEEVDVPRPNDHFVDDGEEDFAGDGSRSHFRDLFARKLDPDGDDSEDEPEEEEGEEVGEEQAERSETTQGEEDEAAARVKRRRLDASPNGNDNGASPPPPTVNAPLPPRTSSPPPTASTSSGFAIPRDALSLQRLTTHIFSRSLATLERLDAAASAANER